MLRLLFLLLPIAAIAGWYAGFKQQHPEQHGSKNKSGGISPDYLLGLNYLINEQPDKAVDVFIKMLEVNDDTAETHIALGSLFRRRGEVDRAIRIHQNLIARPQLSGEQRARGLYELGQDYLRAGVLDRAENIFLELVGIGKDTKASYHCLLNIYQLQKDWQQAIAIAKKLSSKEKAQMGVQIAHYYCELAEKAYKNKDVETAIANLEKALLADAKCVRANMLFGNFAYAAGEYADAIRYYRQVKDQDSAYLSEALVPLAKCYAALNKEADFLSYLEKSLKKAKQLPVILALAHELQKLRGADVAIEFLTHTMDQHLSLRSVYYLLGLYIEKSAGNTKEQLIHLQSFLQKILENNPTYSCSHCGFAGKSFYWQCPGCRKWSTLHRTG